MKEIVKTLVVAILGGVVSLWCYTSFVKQPDIVVEKKEPVLDVFKANYNSKTINSASVPSDFTKASENAIHAVVHVKNTAIKQQENPYAAFFGGQRTRQQQVVGTGSGVIVSSDGYIVTNNHVIEGASDLEVTLNNRKKYKATLIGKDKMSDIALLKIEVEEELPYISFGDSDNAKVGEWVLAVGNPYNLTSTVTAGIISAKGRDLEGDTNINAFIQTDAAVNPGNSGGALVNTRGELVGINTAITSKTGSFIGYSFAVPSNIAKKIIDDILEYGDVKEALLGISYAPNENQIEGVVITGVTQGGGAEKATLEKGDIIKRINDVKIAKFSDLKGQLSAKRPNDEVVVTIERSGEELEILVVLGKRSYVVVNELRIGLKDLNQKDMENFTIENGAKIVQNGNSTLQYYGVKEGYIITKINKELVFDAVDAKRKLLKALRGSSRQLYIEVLNLEGKQERYGFNN